MDETLRLHKLLLMNAVVQQVVKLVINLEMKQMLKTFIHIAMDGLAFFVIKEKLQMVQMVLP